MTAAKTPREAAVVILRRGEATLSEVSRLANVPRQLVRYWAKTAGVDVAARRETTLRKAWERANAG